MPQLPLTGIRILSVEQYGAGPWATMMLADLGAEVIKIENPRSNGDVGRFVPPYTGEKDSIYFQSFNRNKKSITLDIQHEKAFSVLHPLVKASDCVFNNLRGDLPAKLGLDYPSLKDIDPSVVCCSLSAFGRSGSRMSEPGYDYLMQAYTGWMSITGEPDGPPQKTGPSIVDLSAGITAALAVLAAIMRSRESGIGCDVDVSLFDTALSELAYVASWHLTSGYQPKRFKHSSHPSQIPSQLLPTNDGWMVVMCAKEKFYRSLVEIMGMPDLGEDPRFATFEDRLVNRDVLVTILEEASMSKSTTEWLELLKGKVPCAPVNSVSEAFKDEQVTERGLVVNIPHPEFGEIKQVASPINLSDTDTIYKRGPVLGENTEQVLKEMLGWTDIQISDAYQEGVV